MSAKNLVPGAGVLYVVLAVFSGGIQAASTILLASVVCTAGVGLIVWVPLALVLGMLFNWVVSRLRGTPSEPSVQPRSRRDAALRRFAARAAREGLVPESVKTALARAGWSDAEIHQAWQEAGFVPGADA